MDINNDSTHNKKYFCPRCNYTSKKTFLVLFEEQEYRFCEKCYLNFLKINLPPVVELPTKLTS